MVVNNSITKLLTDVYEKVHMETKAYISLLPNYEAPPKNWLIDDFIPTLALLPSAVVNAEVADFDRAIDVAFALELSYIGHLVHSLSPNYGSGADYRMAILVGDYFSSKAAGKLSSQEFIQWSADVGKVICDLSVGSMEKLDNENLDNERVDFQKILGNLKMTNGTLAALAGKMAVEKLDMSEYEKFKYIEFATLAGILQGMKIDGYNKIFALEFANLQNDCLKILVDLPKFETTAKVWILEKIMESNGLSNERNVGKIALQNSSETGFEAIRA